MAPDYLLCQASARSLQLGNWGELSRIVGEASKTEEGVTSYDIRDLGAIDSEITDRELNQALRMLAELTRNARFLTTWNSFVIHDDRAAYFCQLLLKVETAAECPAELVRVVRECFDAAWCPRHFE